jgi:ankyrin repeat protein
LTSEPILQFQSPETWAPSLHFPASDGQNLNISRLAAPGIFHQNPATPYLDTNDETEFASQDRSFHEVISHGTELEITNLLSSGISVSTRDSLNNSPLHTAILRGNIAIVKSLLNYGADVDAVGFKRKTPLHLATVSKGLVQLLLKHQPSLSLQDDEGNTILHYMLLINGWWEDLDVKATIKKILSSGVDINVTNKSGESPLHRVVANIIPASSEYMDILSEFLNYKPDVTSPMRNGFALLALFLANSDILSEKNCCYSYIITEYAHKGFRCLEQFLTAGADPNIMFSSMPLVNYCLEKGTFRGEDPSAGFLMLLLQKADIDFAGSGGNYPLHLALARRNDRWGPFFPTYAVTAALIARKANVNQTNAAGASPLEIWLENRGSHQYDLTKVALLLVKAGAAPTVLTSTGNNLLELLIYRSESDRTCLHKAFLEADINFHQDNSNITAFPDWVEVWHSTWKQPLWHLSKARLTELEEIESRPETKGFIETAFSVVAEHLLERHRSRLKLWQKGDLEKESVKENYEEYCAILRDCRKQRGEVDASWYTYLLDLMDFK